nr:YcxB family protein [uncultured Fluviicola sp.]
MGPKITTNPYQFRASEFAGLYFAALIRKFWFIFLPVLGIVFGTFIYDTIKNPSIFSLIPFGMFTLIFIRSRYQFIRKLKKSPGIERLRIMKVFEHCIEIEDETGNETQFFLVDVSKIIPLRKYYQVNLKTKQTLWIPKDCFKTREDQDLFESHLREKGKMG